MCVANVHVDMDTLKLPSVVYATAHHNPDTFLDNVILPLVLSLRDSQQEG